MCVCQRERGYVSVCVCVVYHRKMCSYAVVSRALEQAPVNHTYNAKCVYFLYIPATEVSCI